LRDRYSVCAEDSTVAMNRSSVHRKRPDRLQCPPGVVFSDTGLGVKRPRVKLTPLLLLVQRLGISGTVLPLSHMLSWHAQGRIYLNVHYFYTNVWTFVSPKALFSLSPKFDFAPRLCLPLNFIYSHILEVYLLRYCGTSVLTDKLLVRNVIRRRTSKCHSANICLASVCLCLNEHD
jgi:hypothetical protein